MFYRNIIVITIFYISNELYDRDFNQAINRVIDYLVNSYSNKGFALIYR